MEILYKDSHIIACIKPAGTLSEGEGNGCLPMLLRQRLSELNEKNTDIYTVHRLDRETAGVMVYARTSAAAACLSAQIQNGEFKKQYLAVIHGVPDSPAGMLRDLLYYDRRLGKSFVVDRERKGVKTAELDYTLLGSQNSLSLISVNLHTGRTHQIRVQFASRSFPLVGDRRYGAPPSEYRGIALLSHKLTFYSPADKSELTFTCSMPSTAPWSLF